MSRNFQSLHKAHINKRGTASRTEQREKERKQKKDDALNKKRHVDVDISPLKELDVSDVQNTKIAKKVPSPKSRMDRLKKWREEKKRKEEEAKKANKDKKFSVKKVVYKDTDLYTHKPCSSIVPNEKQTNKGFDFKESALRRSNRNPPNNTATKAKTNTNKMEKKIPKQPSTDKPKQIEAKPKPIEAKSKPKDKRDVVSRLTASTASSKAKAAGDKQTGYLKKSSKTYLKSKPKVELQVALAKTEEKYNASGSNSDPHLSDSAVESPKHSTPCPAKNNVNGVKSEGKKSKRMLNIVEKKISPKVNECSDQPNENSNPKGKDCNVASDSQDVEMKEDVDENPGPSEVHPAPNNAIKIDTVKNEKIEVLKKTPRRKSARLVALKKESESSGSEDPVALKKTKLDETAKAKEENELVDGLILNEEQRQCITSSIAKRRSIRLQGRVSSNSESEAETEPAKAKQTPRRASRRRSRAPMTPKTPSTSASTAVPLSTSRVPLTPEPPASLTPKGGNDYQVGFSPAIKKENQPSSRSLRRSLVPLGENSKAPTSPLSYHVGGPSGAGEQGEGAGQRALQELTVQKLDGEVPLDDSTCSVASNKATESEATDQSTASTGPFSPQSGNSGSRTSTPSKPSTPLDEQPYTPSQDIQSLVSPAPSPTPRSGRRGRSMAPTPSITPAALSPFKEPGQPASSLRPRSARRKTEHSTPSRTPAQMLRILKKSPMIELNRRRSRHVSSPATSQSNFLVLMSEAENITESTTAANQTAPAELLKELNTGVEALHIPSPAPSTSTSETQASNEQQPSDVICEEEAPMETESSEPSFEELQAIKVKPFRELIVNETQRLNQLCTTWNNISIETAGLSDEVLGQIRSVVGKAQLLMAQRFKQFSGLVDNCEFNTGEKETTPTDLQGFWEMIYFQVEDVDKLFAELQTLKDNDWQVKEPTPVKKVVKKKAAGKASKPKVKSNFAAFRAEMMKRKAGGAPAAAAPEPTQEAVLPPSSPSAVKTFEGGFFKVSSPVRKSGEGPAGEPSPRPLSPMRSGNQPPAAAGDPPSCPATPTPAGDKENVGGEAKPLPVSMKKLRYTPAVSSPLLNDITDL